MRFSAVFQLPLTPRAAAGEEAPRHDVPVPLAQPAAAQDLLPDDLDARVRLVGEWQLGMD